jgi:hypothetical protein
MGDRRARDPRAAWLLGEGAPRTPCAGEGEFERAAHLVLDLWHVMPALLPRLCAWAGDGYDDHPLAAELGWRASYSEVLSRALVAEADRVSGALAERGLRPVQLKGSAAARLLYDEGCRCGLDIDLGLTTREFPAAEAVLQKLGYTAAGRRNCAALRRVQHYELGVYRRRIRVEAPVSEPGDRKPPIHVLRYDGLGDLWLEIEVDLHWALAPEIPLDGILETVVADENAPEHCLYPGRSWLAFAAVYKLYTDATFGYRSGLHMYCDLARLIARMDAGEVAELLALVGAYNLAAPAGYVLRRLAGDLDQEIPEGVRAFVEDFERAVPGGSPMDKNDYGDMWPKLWGRR